MSILHIHNGDMSADRLRASNVPGQHLAWREALPEGPNPAGLKEEEWLRRRAKFLGDLYQMPYYECLDGISSQQAQLHEADQFDEIVLWFEHDLFCQVLLIYLLDWFATHPLKKARLSLVCINGFEGFENFHGLGDLSTPQIGSLFPERKLVNPPQLRLARKAWAAYSAPDPLPLIALMQEDSSDLPFLKTSLECHIHRFPSTENGLGRIRQQMLGILNEHGSMTFGQLFHAFQQVEACYGLGDLQLVTRLEMMHAGNQPLVIPDGPLRTHGLPRAGTLIEITETGRAVWRKELDALSVQPPDYWLGGVHLNPRNIWRYDPQSQTLIKSRT